MLISRSLIATALLFSFSALAEDAERGRLPDGRAYRVDSKGNEIVDYIAELETANDGLNRRVNGLESELEQKQQLIERLQRGGDKPIVEKDLTSGSGARPAPQLYVKGQAESKSAAEVAQLQTALAQQKDLYARETGRLEGQVASLEAALERKTSELQAANAGALRRAQDGDARETASLRVRVTNLEDALSKKNKEIDTLYAQMTAASSQSDALGKERDQLRTQLSEVREQWTNQAAELERVRSQSSKLESEHSDEQKRGAQELASLRLTLGSKDSEIRSLKDQVAQLGSASRSTTAVAAVAAENNSARLDGVSTSAASSAPMLSQSMGQSRMRAIEVLKGKLSTQVNAVRGLVSQRDARFTQYARTPGRRVNLKPAPALSARGLGLQEITGRLRAITSVIELSALSRDINEIEDKVRDDLLLIERMQKVR